jgi:hypothetical protein
MTNLVILLPLSRQALLIGNSPGTLMRPQTAG